LRVYVNTRHLYHCLALAMTVALAVPGAGGTLWAANPNPAPVALGTAKNFGALAGAAISGTGQVKGDVGSAAGAIAPAITSTGIIYPTGDAVATTALADVVTAYNEAKNRTPDVLLSAAAHELGGTTLTRGIYKIGAAATLGSPVTLDAQGDPDAVFIIQIGAAFSATASVGNVILANDAQSANIFWIVEGAVSMGASINLEGNILGNAAVTFGATTTVNGRLLAGAAAGTIAMATAINVPVDPSVVGDRVWFDANVNGIQDPSEITGFSDIPVSLMQLVLEKKTLELGTAANFGALAGAAISGSATVTGNVGSGTGAIAPAVTAPAGTVYATGHAAVMTALADWASAYNDGKNRIPDVLLSAAAHELGGSTLTPGVYKIGAAATLASPVTLDAEGDPEAVFIIQIVGAFGTTAATGNVVLANNAKSANVYWIVEGAVSLGAGTHMRGNILGGAAITFGATSNISGRAMAGTAAGTLALATTVSAVTGTPPVGFPPPIEVANTVTDASGNYLFEGVQPGTLFVRWDLSNFTTDYRITNPKQGEDEALDSDSASGDVSGYVDSTEFVVLGGSTHLGVDLGLAETLPAVKAAARDQLATTLAAYLLANPYTSENWTALQTAKTDGDTAINAATDPAGVAAAKTAALAAMDAVPTVPDTLAAAKVAAQADLTTALAAYLPANYTPENWTTLTTAKTNGDAAIQAAPDLAGVATARNATLSAMDAVPTVAGTLAVAKAAALNDFAGVVATYLEANYTPEGWTAFQTSKTNGQIAIQAAMNLAGVVTATNAALATLDAVPTFTETMATVRAAALNDLTTALATQLETNYYTSENWTALIAARAAGSAAINAATDPAGVAQARNAALATMNAVPTFGETLATTKALALADLTTALAAYLEVNYTPENWTVLTLAMTNGQTAIHAATTPAGVALATNTALAAMDAVPTIAETLAAAKATALANLAALAATYHEADYTQEQWAALQLALANAQAAIHAATDPTEVATATSAALAALDTVPANAETLAAAKAAALANLAAVAATHHEANFTPEQWAALQLALANAQAAIHAATTLTGVATATNTGLAAMDAVPTIAETLAAIKAAALANLAALAATYQEADYTQEQWAALQLALANAQAAIHAATDVAGVATATSAALAALDTVPASAETLAAAVAAALANLAAVAATYHEANFTPEQWAALQLALANAQAAIHAATTLAGVATATNTGVTTLAILGAEGQPTTPTLTHVTPAIGTTAGGTLVTLTGTHFTGATAVTFDGIAASFTVHSATQITATTPAQASGTASVLVTTPSGSHSANSLFTYQTPAIEVIGNGISIGNGEASPSLEALSAFGSVSLLNAQVTRTFTLQNSGTAAFVLTGNPAVQILGADAADFKVTALPSNSIAVGESTTFAITFDPSMPGLRTATVSLASNHPDFNPFTFAVSGFGTLNRSLAQKIVFTAPVTHYLAQGPLMLNAEASSGLPVTLQVVSGPGILSGSILTPTGLGRVTVRATQVGGANYATAKAVTRVITVKANPTVLTLTGLSQRYDGTPKSIGSVGTADLVSVSVSYKVGGVFGTTPPTAAGRYAVLAVAGGVTKKGTLVITKAPLYVVPQDKRKFAGENNPTLDMVYEGFVGSDTSAVLTQVPTLSTSAKVTSPGGTYRITAKSGLATNYTLIYRQGTLVVESFAAGYEALLADAGNLPSGKLSLTVAKSGRSFSGTLALAGETSALRLSGALMTNSLTERATATAMVVSRGATYAVNFTLTMQGELTGSVTQNSQPLATFLDGQRLLLLPSGAKVNFSGAYTGVLEPAQPQGPGVPAGAGWARAKVSTRGAIALVGKLGDGTAFTTTVLPSQEERPSYRLWVQPYKPTRLETFLSGTFELQPNTFNSQLFVVADTSLVWAKAEWAADKSYPAGFVPLTVGLTLDPWVKPTANLPLTGLLGLTADALMVAHSQTGSASDVHLPTTLTLSIGNVVGVAGISNLTKWKTKFNTTNGTFTGSFELMDAGVKRVAKFSGVLRQPAGNDVEVIGDGHFMIPATPGGVETASGEVLFRLP
jgi:TATA-box binding protein (TBP) (component of TFIID and TFIIIB)